jgi:excisionase family DNA binding protein
MKVLTLSEAAEELGCSRRTVRRLIASHGLVGAFRLTRDWRIPASDVKSYQRRADRFAGPADPARRRRRSRTSRGVDLTSR